jgi:hypothetical protein
MARLVAPPSPASPWHGPQTDAERWRTMLRPQVLGLIASSTRKLSWNGRLLSLLLEELYVDDLFTALVGPAQRLPRARYAQAVALAIALRHSWRPDDLLGVATRLGINLKPEAPKSLRPKSRFRNKGHGGALKQGGAKKKQQRLSPPASGERPDYRVASAIRMGRL